MMSKRKRTGLVSWRIVADGFGVSAPMKLTVLDNSGAQQPLLRLLADVETVRPGPDKPLEFLVHRTKAVWRL